MKTQKTTTTIIAITLVVLGLVVAIPFSVGMYAGIKSHTGASGEILSTLKKECDCKEISVNQLNGEEYELPLNLDDSSNIDEFLNRNKHKKVVVVQGLGFVGAVMSLVCANSGNDEYAVIGVDLLNVNT